ncbi:MAG: SRPBCC family protein [Myxococcales bacterium]
MNNVSVSTHIPIDIHELWRKVGHFGDIAAWHPLLARGESLGNEPGALRHYETRDGMRQVERLDEMDPEHHTYRYTLQRSGLPVTNYTGELHVDELSDHTSLLTWTVHFDVTNGTDAEGVDRVVDFIAQGLDGIKRGLEMAH